MIYKPKIRADWYIKDLDDNVVWEPQFPLSEGVQISVGSALSKADRFGQQYPIIQWTKGKERTFTFQTKLFAADRDQGKEILKAYQTLEKMAIKDEKLGRSKICLFVYGKHISETVLIEAIDPKFTDVLLDGTYRSIDLSITLTKYVPFTQFTIDPSRRLKESYYLVASRAEASWEALARRFYGDPMLGDRLRKRHPEYPYKPPVGAKIHIPPRSVILRESVVPSCHVFADEPDAQLAFQYVLDERNKRTARLSI